MAMKVHVGLISNDETTESNLMYGVYNIDKGYLCSWNRPEDEPVYIDLDEYKSYLPDRYMYFTVEVEEITSDSILQALKDTYPELIL